MPISAPPPSRADQPDTPEPGQDPDLGPNVVLEDLDHLEDRRRERRKRGEELPPELRATVHDPALYRRLFEYVPPFRNKLILALLLSIVAAAAKVGYLFTIKGQLQPLFETGATSTPPAQALFTALVDLLLGGGLPDWLGGAPFSAALAALASTLRSAWDAVPPMEQLQYAAVFMVGLVVLEQANRYVQRLLMRGVSLEVIRVVRADLFKRLMGLSMRFFQANHSGKLLARLTGDLNKLGNLLVDVMVPMLSDIFTVIGSVVYVWVEGGAVVILALVFAAVSFVPIQQLARRIRGKEFRNQKQMSEVFRSLQEALSAQKIVKAFGAEQFEIERFNRVNDRVTEGRMKAAELRARTDPVVEILGALGVAAFMIWGGSKVIAGGWEGAAFFAVVFALTNVVASLRRLSDTSTKMQTALSSADRVATLLYAEPEIVDRPGAVELEPFQREIAFRDVHFAHDADQPVLKGIDFRLAKGQTLALVGHTGSGKSTIADLLVRFFEVDRGAVLIDGHDVREVTLESLRRQLAVVTQETLLFQGTVRENIAYARPDTPMEEVEAAARAAFAHDFISALPDGYDTQVGERGTSLSGGERQRIALARALISGAPILLLDEATSALDTRAERIVQEAIDRISQDHTAVIIAHRLSTIRNADQILVLDKGAVAERGTHDELIALDGIYASMIRMQDEG